MTESNDFTTRTKINTVQLGLWTGAWVLTTALAAFGPKFFWEFNTPLTILGVLMTLVASSTVKSLSRLYNYRKVM